MSSPVPYHNQSSSNWIKLRYKIRGRYAWWVFVARRTWFSRVVEFMLSQLSDVNLHPPHCVLLLVSIGDATAAAPGKVIAE